jgi:hypothetical protein
MTYPAKLINLTPYTVTLRSDGVVILGSDRIIQSSGVASVDASGVVVGIPSEDDSFVCPHCDCETSDGCELCPTVGETAIKYIVTEDVAEALNNRMDIIAAPNRLVYDGSYVVGYKPFAIA